MCGVSAVTSMSERSIFSAIFPRFARIPETHRSSKDAMDAARRRADCKKL